MSSLFSDKSNFLLLTNSALEKSKESLQEILKELASQIRPFPGFLNMQAIQAIENPVPKEYSEDYMLSSNPSRTSAYLCTLYLINYLSQ